MLLQVSFHNCPNQTSKILNRYHVGCWHEGFGFAFSSHKLFPTHKRHFVKKTFQDWEERLRGRIPTCSHRCFAFCLKRSSIRKATLILLMVTTSISPGTVSLKGTLDVMHPKPTKTETWEYQIPSRFNRMTSMKTWMEWLSKQIWLQSKSYTLTSCLWGRIYVVLNTMYFAEST